MNKKFSTLVAALLVSGGSFVVASQYMGSPLMSSPLAVAAAANLRATGAVAENYSIGAAKAASFGAAKIWTATAVSDGITFETAKGSVLYSSAGKIALAKAGTQPASVFTVDAEGKLKVGDLYVLISTTGLSLGASAEEGKNYVSAYSEEAAVAETAGNGKYALAEDTRAVTGVSSVKLNTEVSNPVFAASAAQNNLEGATTVSTVQVVDWWALKIADGEYLTVDGNGAVGVGTTLDRTTSEVSVSEEGYVSVASKKLYLNTTSGKLTTDATDGKEVYLATGEFSDNMSSNVLKTSVTAQSDKSLFAVTEGEISSVTKVSVFKYTASVTTNTFKIDATAGLEDAVKATFTATGNTLAVGGKLIKSDGGTVTADDAGTAISLDTDGAIKIETSKFLVIDNEELKAVNAVNTESKLYLYKDGAKVTTLPAEGTAQYVIANVQYGSQFTTDILTVTATETDAVEATPGAEIPGMDNVTTDENGKITGLTSGKDIVAPFTISPSNGVYLAVSGSKVVKLSGDDAAKIEKNINAAWVMKDGNIVSVAKALAGAEKRYLKVEGNTLRATTTELAQVTLVAEANASEASITTETLSIGNAEAGTMTLSEAALPAIGFEESGDQPLIKGAAGSGPYLLSAVDGKYIKGTDASTDASDPAAMWKVESQTLSDGTVFYSFYHGTGSNKTYLTIGGETSFVSVNDLKYNSGLALMIGDQYLKVNANGGLELGNTYSVIGFFQVGENAIEADDLMDKRETGFDMTIAVSDAEGASTTIQGNPFTGILTPRKKDGNGNLVDAAAGDATFYLMNADGSYIVQNLSATWSGTTEWMLNGDNIFDRGYKFTTVSAKDFKEKVLTAEAGKYNYRFRVSCSAAETAADASEIFVDVMDGTTNYVFGRLYVAEMLNGSAVSYLLTSSDGLVEDSKEHYPYITFGGTSLLSMKAFLTTPQFYTVAQVDKNGNILSVLGATANDAANWYEKGAIQQDQPEGQFAAAAGDTDAKLVLSNRENPTSQMTLSSLYKTDKADIYKAGNNYYKIEAVAKHTAHDGYEVWSNSQVRDEQYTIGFYSNVLGAAAYMSENHSNNHVIGLEKDIKDATSWKLKAYEESKAEDGTRTDSIYVISNLNYYNKSKAEWKTQKDTLKVVAYSLTNTANDEVFDLVEGLYISNPVNVTAPRFAFKKKADGKYNLVKVKSGDTNYEFDANKLYGGFSVAQGVVKETGKYTLTENDLVVFEKVAAPEYVKLNMGDTIRIFREGAEASQLFEKGEFLGMENVFEFTKMAPAMYVDTAYYNRLDNNRWEYLLVVEPKQVTSETACSDPTHGVHKADTVFGRFLVNLVDSAYADKNLHNKKYVNTDGYAKLGFVKGFHTNDTLVIQRAGVEKAAKADSLFLGSKDPSFAKFAFRVVDNETSAFKIETAYKPSRNAEADMQKGYLKWMNGVIVVIENENNADIFNLKATDENPTANEAIEAAGVQVIGGQGVVTVQGAAGKVITVANILGQTIANQVATSDNVTIAAPAGVVVVAVDGDATKVVVK